MYVLFISSLVMQEVSIICKYNPIFIKQSKNTPERPSNPHPSQFIKDMNEQELNNMLTYAKQTDQTDFVFKIFHFLMTVTQSQDALRNYKLDLADYCYQLKDFEKASVCYEEFFHLYPGSNEAEYTQYKAILCWFYRSLAPDKDQSFTDKTLILVEDFLNKAKNKAYIQETNDIKQKCRQKLFEHEACVFETYIKHKKFKGAQKRLEYIKEHFQDIKDLDRYTAYLEKMHSIASDPHRPFFIHFNLQDALSDKKESTNPEKKKKTALFFLS